MKTNIKKRSIEIIVCTIILAIIYRVFVSDKVKMTTADAVLLINVVYVIICVSLCIISCTLLDFNENKNNAYMSVGFCVSSVISLIQISIAALPKMGNMGLDYSIRISVISDIILIYTIISMFLYVDKPLNYRTVFIKFPLVAVIILFCIMEIKTSIFINEDGKVTFYYYIAKAILALVGILIVFLLYKNRERVHKSTAESLYIIAFIIIMRNVMVFVFFSKATEYMTIFKFVYKGLLSYELYQAFLKSILEESYKVFFKNIIEKNNILKNKVEEVDTISKNLEKAIKKYKHIIEYSPDPIAMLFQGEIFYVNKRLTESVNLTKDKLIGRKVIEFFPEEYHNKLFFRDSLLKKGMPLAPAEYELAYGTFEISSSYILDEEDREICISVGRDLSQRKAVQEINRLIEENNANEKTKNEFFTNISHEFKTPVNVIYSAVQLQGIYMKNRNLKELSRQNGMIRQNCLRLIKLINNLIDSTRIQHGFFKSVTKVENIVQIIENTCDEVSSQMIAKNMNIIFDTDEEEIICLCDTGVVERIILNLLSNAIKNNAQNKDILVTISSDEDKVTIEVEDNGEGVPIDYIDNIFDRFKRADTTLSRKAEGSGIGLSITKDLVTLLGGNISVRNKENSGAVFKITLNRYNKYTDNDIERILNKTYEVDHEKVRIELSDIYF